MIEIFKIIFLIAFPVLEAYRDYLIFPVKIEVSKRWHSVGFALRGLTAILLIVPYYQYIPLYAFYFWIVFDLVTGVGHTALIDKTFGKSGIYFKLGGLVGSGLFLYLY